MDRVIEEVKEQLEPMVKKADEAIAKYPSLTQYGMSFFVRVTDSGILVSKIREDSKRVMDEGCNGLEASTRWLDCTVED